MYLTNVFRAAILWLPAISLHPAGAQQIAEADKQGAIQSIANNIAVYYFDIEKGGQIASYIQMRYHEGDFFKANNWAQFDEMVTKSLQEYSKDAHLYVRNNPAMVKNLNQPSDGNSNINGEVQQVANFGFTETTVLDGNIGYLRISAINITKESLPVVKKSMDYIKNTRALVIDLRDNKGGGSAIGPVLESYFLPPGTPLLEFKTRKRATTIDSTVSWLNEKRYDNPVYIIINKKTASAAEAFAYVLQQNKKATIVGERSAGAANKNEYFAINSDNYVSVSTASPSLPGKHNTWQQKGIIPDIKSKTDDPLAEIISRVNKH